ncbi:MAG: RNA polymerase sigma factor [Bacteroidota bacterium]
MQPNPELIPGLINGDHNTFRDIFNILYPRMLCYCEIFVRDRQEAEDIVQDCFIKLWSIRDTVRTDGNLEKLMFVMLRNRCLNFLRDSKLTLGHIDITAGEIEDIQQLYHIDFLDKEDSPAEQVLLDSLKEAVGNLPPRQKEVLQRTKFLGLSQKEVASDLGISIKAVEKNITQARKKIREELLRKFPEFWIILPIAFFALWK